MLAHAGRVGDGLQPERVQHGGAGHHPGGHHDGVERQQRPVLQPYAGQPVGLALQGRHQAGHHRHPGCREPREVGVGRRHVVGQQHHPVGEPAEQHRLVRGHRSGGEHADPLVADLPAVAERAVQHLVAPPLGHARHVGQVVLQPGRDQQPPAVDDGAVLEVDLEAAVGAAGADGAAAAYLAAVGHQVGPALLEQCERGGALPAEQVVHPRGGGVARGAGVHHQHPSPRPRQRDRPAQPGGAASDHHHVVPVLLLHCHVALLVVGGTTVRDGAIARQLTFADVAR